MSRVILLADDSVTIQKVIELTFMDEDYQVLAVSNGDDAVAKLQEVEPDIVISDVHMPGASGYDVCRHSKQQSPAVPVLLLVGTFEPFDESEAEAAGADSFLKKPFDSQELLRRVEELLAGRAGAPPAAEAPAAEVGEEPPEPAAQATVGDEELGEEEELEAWDQVKIATEEEEGEPEPVWSNFDAGATASEAAGPREAPPTPGEESPRFSEEELPPLGEEPFPAAGMEALPSASEAELPPAAEGELPPLGESAAPEPEPVSWEPLKAEEALETAAPETAAPEPEAAPAEAAWERPAPAAEPVPPPPLAVPEPAPPPVEEAPAPAAEATPAEEMPTEETPAEEMPADKPAAGEVPAAAPAAAVEPSAEPRPTVEGLSDEDVDRIARRVAALIGEKTIRDIAWEVIPDLAEIIIRDRLKELESELESQVER